MCTYNTTVCTVCGTLAGPHKIDVTYEGIRVPNSAFTAGVVPGCDPSRVKVYGAGEKRSCCHVCVVVFMND